MNDIKAFYEVTENEDLGKIVFANEVIATIAGIAAFETKGIAGMSGGIVDGFAEMIGRKNMTKGVKIELGAEEAAIDIFVIAKYGVNIQDAAKDMQKNVKSAIESMTGIHVTRVTVNIQGLEFEKEPKPIKESNQL
jgi:uncharacterized alkaline shock family protein YloU